MASTPSKHNPNIQHNFEGDSRILNSTFERRTELRKALTALAQDLQRIEGSPTQIKAEIKLQIGGRDPKEHVYKISITDQQFDAAEFSRVVPHFESDAGRATSIGAASSPQTVSRRNGQPVTPGLSTPRLEAHRTDADPDVMEIRPFKRQKVDSEKTSKSNSQQQDSRTMAQAAQQTGSGPNEETLTYLGNWHDEWTRQGGWLFDTLSKTHTTANGIRGGIEKRMEAVQDVLGQSINASNAATIAELGSITKLIHWLEHCRKTSADKVQAREEKWRSSSATFHDSTRREREAAEKRIEKKLDAQNELLKKLAHANNISDDRPGRQSGGSDDRSREASLGAQLTAELNMEAGHGGTGDEPFNIDD